MLIQALAFALVAQPPVPPGILVDLGGQRLHVSCSGHGAPTVLLEAGTGDFSVIWSLVQPKVAAFSRVCSYDRGGYAWSEPGERPRTFAQLALELHTALSRALVEPPYLLVGQSYGGLVVRGFADRYRTEVVGMVLVDAVHEDQRIVYGGRAHRIRDGATGRPAPAPVLALDTAILRQARDSQVQALTKPLESPLDRLPAWAQQVWRWAAALPVYRMAQRAELDWSPEELARMHEGRLTGRSTLGDLPLIVLARTRGDDSLEAERRSLQADLARLSTRGQLIFAKHSGHNIHLEDPDLVVRAIRRVEALARRAATI